MLYQLAGQHLKPDESGMPPAATHSDASSLFLPASTAANIQGGDPH